MATIPFELRERFTVAINRKTATALDLRIHEDVYLRADQVFDEWADDRKPAATQK